MAAASVVALAALTGCASADATATEPSTVSPEPTPLADETMARLRAEQG